jgi:hypothetical protein
MVCYKSQINDYSGWRVMDFGIKKSGGRVLIPMVFVLGWTLIGLGSCERDSLPHRTEIIIGDMPLSFSGRNVYVLLKEPGADAIIAWNYGQITGTSIRRDVVRDSSGETYELLPSGGIYDVYLAEKTVAGPVTRPVPGSTLRKWSNIRFKGEWVILNWNSGT